MSFSAWQSLSPRCAPSSIIQVWLDVSESCERALHICPRRKLCRYRGGRPHCGGDVIDRRASESGYIFTLEAHMCYQTNNLGPLSCRSQDRFESLYLYQWCSASNDRWAFLQAVDDWGGLAEWVMRDNLTRGGTMRIFTWTSWGRVSQRDVASGRGEKLQRHCMVPAGTTC